MSEIQGGCRCGAVRYTLALVIFATIVAGIARMGDLKEVGNVGAKALLYFEVLSTIALVVGLVVVNLLKPGVGMNVNPATLDTMSIEAYTSQAHAQTCGAADFIMNIIPKTIVGSFADGNVQQIIFFAVLFGAAMARLGARGKPVIDGIDLALQRLFGIVRMVVFAPIGALGAIAFTIGKYGIGSLAAYGKPIVAVRRHWNNCLCTFNPSPTNGCGRGVHGAGTTMNVALCERTPEFPSSRCFNSSYPAPPSSIFGFDNHS